MTRNFHRSLTSILLISMSTAGIPVRGDDRSIVAAATANALDDLKDDVTATRIDPRLTVATFLKKTGGSKQLIAELQRAEEIGGPRFSTDGQACQIQLQIAGDRVARALISIASSNPRQSPIPPDVLAREVEDWRERVFSGTGSSVSGASLRFVRPAPAAPQDAWAGVSDSTRQQAVNAARDSAIRQVIDSIEPIPFSPPKTVGDLLQNKAVNDAISNWLNTRPVKQVQFTPEREIELTLWTPPNDLCDQLLNSARLAKLPLPDPTDEAILRQRFSALPNESRGRASAPMAATTSGVIFAVDMPGRPPAWVDQQLVSEGMSESRGNKLKTARSAESAAREGLQLQINRLPLNETLTVGQAAERSPFIARSLAECMKSARPFRVEYRADGSVLVRSTIDARLLWAAITGP